MKFVYTLCIAIFIMLAGCKDDYTAPCRQPLVIDSFDFTSAQRSIIPYSMNDTVVYVCDNDDSLVFLTRAYNDQPVFIVTDQPGNPECPANDYVRYDRLSTTLTDISNAVQLYYAAVRPADSCVYRIISKEISLPLAAIGARDSTYRDSLSLGSHTFYNVNGFINEQGDSFYINGALGVLQFNWNNKNFTLQQFNSKWK